MNLIVVFSLIIIGLIAGVLSGFIGVGMIMIPLLILLLDYDQLQAHGMSLAVLAVPVTFVAAFKLFFQNRSGQLFISYLFSIQPLMQ